MRCLSGDARQRSSQQASMGIMVKATTPSVVFWTGVDKVHWEKTKGL